MNARRRLTGTIAAAAVMLVFGARIAVACDEQAKAEAKDAKASVAADGKESKGGCAAHCAKKGAAEAKNVATPATPATVTKVTPAAAGKNAKKTVKTEAAPAETPKPEAPSGAGSNR